MDEEGLLVDFVRKELKDSELRNRKLQEQLSKLSTELAQYPSELDTLHSAVPNWSGPADRHLIPVVQLSGGLPTEYLTQGELQRKEWKQTQPLQPRFGLIPDSNPAFGESLAVVVNETAGKGSMPSGPPSPSQGQYMNNNGANSSLVQRLQTVEEENHILKIALLSLASRIGAEDDMVSLIRLASRNMKQQVDVPSPGRRTTICDGCLQTKECFLCWRCEKESYCSSTCQLQKLASHLDLCTAVYLATRGK